MLFFIVLFAPWILAFLAIVVAIGVLNQLTAKPKAPPYVDTPEEAAARQARARMMLAELQEIRASHHH